MPVPIIIISQKNETKDVIGGLRKGAVDYIRKPFVSEEVLARLGAILRFHVMDLQQRRFSAKQVRISLVAVHSC
jgi:DNA-binding response OmpR family regulator